MNSLAEALGMSLPGSAAIPAPYRDRQEAAYRTGLQIVEMIEADRKPSQILTREAFLNAIRVNSAIGGSTNAPIHLIALARHMGVELTIDDWQEFGRDIPLLVNLQPAGEYLGEDFYRAGGVPAVVSELMKQGLINEGALTANGRTIGENNRDAQIEDEEVIRPFDRPMKQAAGFSVLRGNLFDSAIMKLSVISDEFRERYLSNPDDPDAFEGPVVVFDGPEDYHRRIDDPTHGHRREDHPDHARRRSDRIPGRGRSGEHAGACRTAEGRHPCAALHGRRPPVRNVRVALDPQRVARSRRGWRTCAPAKRRPRARRSQARRSEHSDRCGGTGRGAVANWRPREASASLKIKRPGRRSTATPWASCRRAQSSNRRRNIKGSARLTGFLGTIIETRAEEEAFVSQAFQLLPECHFPTAAS